MKIAGIFPESPYKRTLVDPYIEDPLGIGYCLAYEKMHGNDVQLFIPFDKYEKFIKRISDFNPEILAISAYTKHANITLRIAEDIKKIKPNVKVVVGNYHVTGEPSFVENENIDVGILGEGEKTFHAVIEAFEGKGDLRNIKGIAYKGENGKAVVTGISERIQNLDELPWPVREPKLLDINFKESLYRNPTQKTKYTSIVLSRGCYNKCWFCASPKLTQRRVYERSIDNVIEEINFLNEQYGVNFLTIEDLNFGAKRERVERFCKAFREKANPNIYWWTENNISDFSQNLDLIYIMVRSNAIIISFGLESTSPETLAKIGKRYTDPEDAKKVLNACTEAKLLVQGFYIIGWPWETEKDILKFGEEVKHIPIDQLRLTIATPFPGSQWYNELEKSKLNPDWSLWDTDHLVYEHPTISPERMNELQLHIVEKFYHSKEWLTRLRKKARGSFFRNRPILEKFLLSMM